MEKALKTYPNRFQLTMMAVARAREINDGDDPAIDSDDPVKPVVAALVEISEGKVVPASQEEMTRIREAKRIIRERALMEAREQDDQLFEKNLSGSMAEQEDTSGEI
jgi:DNA-directed RNA polymerase omega subunit